MCRSPAGCRIPTAIANRLNKRGELTPLSSHEPDEVRRATDRIGVIRLRRVSAAASTVGAVEGDIGSPRQPPPVADELDADTRHLVNGLAL